MEKRITRFVLTLSTVLLLVLGATTNGYAQEAAEIVSTASCDDADGMQVAERTYFVVVDTVFGEMPGTFEVTVDGMTMTFDPANTAGSGDGNDLYFGPFTHSGTGGGGQEVSAVASADAMVTGLSYAPEVLCGVTPDGGQASGGFCMPTTDPDALPGSILAQSAPGTFMAGGATGQEQAYVLVDAMGFIVQANRTGLFTGLPSDTFQVFAVNYRDTEPLDDFLVAGQSFAPILNGVDDDDTNSALDGACYTICNTDPVIMVPVNCLSIGSTVFTDNDDDATYEPADGEMGISGVTVNLYAVSMTGMADSLVATTMTDADGNYFFGGLDEGMYTVSIPTTPAGFPISSTNATPPEDVATGDDMDSGIQDMPGDSVVSPIITLTAQMEPTGADEAGEGSDQDDNTDMITQQSIQDDAGAVATSATNTSDDDANGDMTVDFGFFPGLSLGSTVFADPNNNGLQEAGEMGIGGVTVNLYEDVDMDGVYTAGTDTLVATTTTDPVTGDYFFDMLIEAGYFVSVVPDDMFPVSSNGAGEEADPNADMDGNDNGIMNAAGSMMLVPGEEVFSGVVSLSPGDEPTDDGTGTTSAGMEDAVSGTDQDGMGGSAQDANGNMTVDFGFFPGLSIGSTVFADNDNNGMYDPTAGESGIPGVRVYLQDMNGDRIDSTFTDSDGNYFFGGLTDGTYMVEIGAEAFQPGGPLADANTSSTPTEEGDENIDNNDNGIQENGPGTTTVSGPILLSLGDEPVNGGGDNDETGAGSTQDDSMDENGNMTVDFGFYTPVSIGSQVFYDIDNSGDNNGNTEAGIDDVTVLLFDDVDMDGMYTSGVDTLVDMTVTMGGGLYEFDTLAPGDYIVAIVPPDTANLSSNGSEEDTTDSQSDGDDNGIQAMAGDTIFSVAINLTPGEEPTNEDDPVDGGDQDNVAAEDNDGDMTIDFGVLPSVSVGSTVFQDDDNSGVQENDEEGVEGIIVTLLDGNGDVVATDTTDMDGNYFFDGLTPGDYQLQITPPDSLPTSSTMDSVNGENGDSDDDGIQENPGDVITTPVFTLTPNGEPEDEDGEGSDQDDGNENDGNTSYDFGLIPNYSLGSTVFADLNNDADQGDDEDGVPGVPVTLYSDVDMDGYTPGVDTIVATTVTEMNGDYFFDNLLPGDYVVGIVPTDELPLSSDEDADEDDPNLDVDGNDNGMQAMSGDSIFSGTVTLGIDAGVGEPVEGAEDAPTGGDQDDDSGLEDLAGNQTVDFGLFPGVSVGSTVFADLNNDGMQGTDEDGIPGVPVILYSDAGMDGFTPGVDTIVATTVTDGNGDYFFDMLPEGNYVVAAVPNDEFPVSSTDPGTEGDEMTDGDDDGQFGPDGMAPMSGDTVFSATVELTAGDEPTFDDGEDQQGSGQDGDDNSAEDANGNMTVDFGFTPGVSVGSTVFFDLDNDGLFEPSDGESGIAGVEVYLYADDGVTVLDSTVTDADGNYFFGGLDEGDYIVGIPASSFAVGEPLESAPNSSTPTFGEADDQMDNNDNGIQPGGAGTIVQSNVITLTYGGEPTSTGDNGADPELGPGAAQDDEFDANGDMTVDFGFFPTLSIGSQVFYDIDNSGDNNSGTEDGVDGVEVLLFTDVDGDNMYTPGVDTLVDMTVTMGGGLYEFDTLPPGNYIVAVVPPDTANLSSNGPNENTADDQSDNNDNGIQAMAGDTIFSTAINLAVGEEPENEDPTTGGNQDMDDDQDDDGDMTIDFGILPSVSVGSTVFQDDDNSGVQENDEEGVEGIIVTLLDGNGDVVATDTTDMDGNYFFDGLTPGDYQLQITPPDSLPTSSTMDSVNGENGDSDDDGIQENPGDVITTPVFTLTPNGEPEDEDGEGSDQDDGNENDGNTSYDFGLIPNYSLGSTVFADLNNDADQGDDEDGVPGVPVTLYSDVDMDGYTPGVDTIVATTVTDMNGDYFFDNLLPGDYVVGIVPTDELPLSSDEVADEDDPNLDVDGNDNGMQAMSGDSIFSGTVTLGIDAGVGEPVEGAEDAPTGGDQDDDSGLEDLAGNQTVDFGLFPGVSVGSTVFADLNNDGMQGTDEDGIPGVPVILYSDAGMDGFTPGVDTIVATTVTDGNGDYFFDMLPEGNYVVAAVPNDEFPVSSTDPGTEGDEMTDGDDDGQFGPDGMAPMSGDTVFSATVELTAGDEPTFDDGEDQQGSGQDGDDNSAEDANGNMTVDFGFTPGVSVGSTVFFDLDNDGLFEPSDGESGIAGVEVYLYADDGVTVLDSTVTDADGNYFFGGLDEGDYIVGIPASSFAVGEPLESAPNSSTPTFGEADDQMDNNDNGIQPGGAGTIVQSNVITLTYGGEPTSTGDNGADPELGPGAAQDDEFDANGDMTVDFGFFPTLSIGSQVFYDIDNSGDNNSGTEDGVDGVEVLLFTDVDGDNMYTPGVDTLVDMTVTMGGGLYEFDTLPPGNYIVAVVPPDTANLSSNGPNENTADDQSDNNDNGIQAMAGDTIFSTAINLAVGEEPENEDPTTGGNQDMDDDQDDDGDMTIDFGILPSVSVGSTVFQDDDNSGVQENDEEGVEGIIVTLLDGNGDVVATDTTDMDGNYFFDGLTPGDYQLQITPPDSLPTSSTMDSVNGENGDSDDDGIQENPGDVITTPVFTLTPNGEPEDEDGEGSDQDDGNENDGNTSYDFGLIPNYSLGSTVFADLNNDADQGDDEDGVPGVPVTLYSDVDMDGYTPGVDTIVATTVTDMNGDYFFDNLLPGDYVVGIVPTDELPLSSDEDADEDDPNLDVDGNDNGMQAMSGDSIFSGTVTLGIDAGVGEPVEGAEDAPTGGDQDDDSGLEDLAGNQTVDFGLFPGVSVGSSVWLDTDNDGMYDVDEDGIGGILVVLYDNATMMAVDSVLTDDNGNYFFDGLVPGDYYIEIPGDQLVGGNGLFDMDASSSTPDNNADDDDDNNDDGSQVGGPGTTITSGVFTLGVGEEPVNGIDGEQDGGSTQDDDFDANGNMTVDFGIFVPMFDLALIKELAPGQSPNVEAGDTVAFQILIFNQGNIAADSILVSDYFPSQVDGFTFDMTIPGNEDWMVASVIGDTTRLEILLTDFNGADTLAMDSFITVDLFLVVNPAMEAQMPLTNIAEVSDATGPNGLEVEDIDSPMDTIPGNDPFFEDNEINGNGLTGGDEDNSDPATILVGGFDLALIKTLTPGQSSTVSPGEEVSFDITVVNQGAIIADNVVIVDYVPDGFVFDPALNLGWSLNADGNPVDTLSIANGDLFEGGLEPGEQTTVQIILTVADEMFPDFADGMNPDSVNMDGVESGQVLVNEAEIASATDGEGNDVDDIDSNADDEQGNDGEIDDDDLNGGGDTDGDGIIDDDEDDNDIAIVTVECYQDPGVDNTIQVCLGCDEAEVVINLFESLGGLPNVGGTFSEGDLIFMDEDGNPVTVVDTDGNELGSDDFDPTMVVIPGTLDRTLDFSIDYTIAAVNDCPEMTATITLDIVDIQNLSCTGFQNISLGEDCEAEITPDLILQGNLTCASSLEVVILTTAGDTLRDLDGNPTSIVNNGQVNQTLYVSLVDPMCDNSCWGQILVEDKKRPEIDCPADADGFNGFDFICDDIDQILNQQSSLAFTGSPVVSDNCTPEDQLVVDFSDFLIPNADPQCTPSTILRTFTVTDASGNFNSCVQRITVRPATLDDVVLPTLDVVEISCGEDFEALPNGNPVPSLGGEATITTAFGTFNIPGNGSFCNIAATFVDSERIVTCENTFKFVRTYTIFDWCAAENGTVEDTTFTQVVKVGDFDAPEFVAPTQDLDFDGIADDGPLFFPTNVGGENCAAIFQLDLFGIGLTDNCSATIGLTAQIFPNGDLDAAPIGTFVVDLNDGDAELTTPVPVGSHVLRYTYVDACGNSDFTDIDIEIADRTAPVAVCEDGLNISITSGQDGDDGVSTGIAILTPDMIDAGSTDDCSGVTLEIARVNASNIATEAYDQELVLTCADLGIVRVGLKVTDALGNMNFCWLDVLVEDKNAPTCIPPGPVNLTCVEYLAAGLPADIGEASEEELNAIFGSATGIDNCEVTVTSTISGGVNNCGVGSLTRNFTATDGEGFVDNNNCVQFIDVRGVFDYRITFPTDAVFDECVDPDFDELGTEEFACDLITVNVTMDTVASVNAPDACYTLRVNYDIINFCEYNQLGECYRIPRDGDGIRNPDTQLLYLNVIPNNTANTDDDEAFLSRFTDRTYDPNAPQRDQLVDDGDDNDGSDDDNDNDSEDQQAANGVGFAYAQDDSRGYFCYVQFVDVYDEVAPTIEGDEPEECFAGTSIECTAEVELTFTAEDNCTAPVVTVELDADYNVNAGFIPVNPASVGVSVSVSNDSINYTVNASNVPVGNHAIRVRANDGCGNFDTEIIEFCVVGDKAPTPICIQTLTVTLMPDGNGGGMAEIWASDFIASDVEDCFGNVIDKYSIYTEEEAGDAGFEPVAGDLGLQFTCDDYNGEGEDNTVPVRVYAIADNGSADYCAVVVDVQAFQEDLCDDDGNGGNLAGVIMTEEMNTVEEVLVTLEGADDFTTNMTTTDNGGFLFTGLEAGVDYTITPTHYTNYLNGVRTSDIVGITQHILGLEALNSPYKMIAADVDGNEEINVGDIINIRRLILGLSDVFPNGQPSWEFVPADYEFNDMLNPWAAEFPSVINVNDLAANIVDADFIGVKLGDVNGSAIANVMQPAEPRNFRGDLELELDETEMNQGETYTIPVTAPKLTQVEGYQFTLEFDRTAVSIEGIVPGLVEEANFGFRFQDRGLITTSWNWEGGTAPANWNGDEVLFSLIVRAEAPGLLSDAIEAGSRYTEAEAYLPNNEGLRNLTLVFNEDIVEVAGYNLLQNVPNPVRKETIIGYELPQAHDRVTISITDAAGRLVREFRQEGIVGYNSVRVTKRQLGNASGVYTYTVSAGDWVATKRMVVIE